MFLGYGLPNKHSINIYLVFSQEQLLNSISEEQPSEEQPKLLPQFQSKAELHHGIQQKRATKILL